MNAPNNCGKPPPRRAATREKDSPVGAPWKKLVAIILAIVSAIVLVVDFFTKVIGIVESISERIAPPLTPLVYLHTKDQLGGGECLEFSFMNLPEDFVRAYIHLQIVETSSLPSISDDMPTISSEQIVHREWGPDFFILEPEFFQGDDKKITISPHIRSEKNRGVAYVDFCPTLWMVEASAWIRVDPSFFLPSGEPIKDIKVIIQDGEEGKRGVTISTSSFKPKEILHLWPYVVRVMR